jgi:tRNA A-37 threonylcarbamoyl transferase component Bud32
VTHPVRPAEAIFLALADLNSDERDAFLREHCGHDSQLRAEVEAMLQAIDATDDEFLDPARLPSLDMAAGDSPLQPGTVLSNCFVLHAIGSGGVGVVYAAQQEHPRRTVAIKVLRRGFRRPEILKRFEREAELLGRLQHPGVAQVFAFSRGNRRVPAHLVMEFVTGPPITEYVEAQALGYAARIELMIAVCEAVQHAHDRGIIHRDLKPANVLVSDAGRPKILDFGIARATGLDVDSILQTAHGEIVGTVPYMSPERLRGVTGEVDARSDIYALGVMFYRLMAGRLPFDVRGITLLEAAQRILRAEVPPLGSVDHALAGSIEQVAKRSMSPDREQRYQSPADLATDLRACLEDRALAQAHTAQLVTAAPAFRPLMAESDDHRSVAVGLVSGTVLVLDASSGTQLSVVRGDGTRLERLTFDTEGRLAMGWASGRVDQIEIPGQ